MAQSSNKADRRKQDIHMRLRTLVATALFLIFGFGVLIYQLYALQLRDAELYRTEAVAQQLKDTVLPAARGSILSANGKVLAKSNTVWNIICDPSSSVKAGATDAQLQTAAEEIANLLNDGTTAEAVYSVLTATNDAGEPYQYRVVAKGVEKPVADAILAYADEYRIPAENENATGARIVYLRTEQTSVRSYPYGEFLASVLGFCNADGEGSYGLEKSYEETLAGTPGRSIAETNRDGEVLDESAAKVYDAVDGNDLVLTIDENVQSIVEKYLDEAMDTYQVHGRGCAIVMNVKTGAILAMASKPDFDPNDPLNYTANEAYLNELVHAEPELYGIYKKDADGNYITDELGNKTLDEEADYSGYYRDILWKNKTITELYYPGSVFKVITSAMGIDSGVATMNTTLTCSGAYGVAKETYHCAGRKAHGTINMAEALRKSCNIYYIQLGQRVGSQQFYNYFDAFGFTARTGVDLPSETNFMQYYRADQLGEVQLASSSFGQAMAITPLQMCTAIAATVNGGYLVTPHVVDKITDANGNVIQEIGANVRRQVISQSASEVIRQMMEYEVGNGTGGGKNAYVSGYRIGGKSGTSEQLNMHRRADGDYKKVASFVAVLPANDPEILVYVMLDDPNNAQTDYSSILAAPVAGNIISEVAPYLGIATDGEDRSGTIVTVPNLVGNEWSNAQVSLNIQGLKHQLQESQSSQTAAPVTYQYPHAGTKVPYGTTIYLYTDTYEGSRTEVPDVTGKSPDFARQMLSAAGLNCVVEGSGTVQAQSAEPGSSVQRGTIITLTCG